ncbi:hypothetical protein [Candidatus Electronema sp. TJ]|uniref:hypothetical protein n=1 Tax=Candidatus Electronema sp. TJ TaxID=3401573 RepID=UPI003AA7B4AD
MDIFCKTSWLSGILLLLAGSGCTTINSSMSNITAETPHPALTSLTETLKCMGGKINEAEQLKGVLLLVDDFYDGTVPVVSDIQVAAGRSVRGDGPLADGGKYDFEAIIKRTVSGNKIILPYSMPQGLMLEDKYGRIPPEYLIELTKIYSASHIFRIKGIFTQNDSADYYNKGASSGGETKGKHGETEIEYGVSKASRSLSLAVHIGNPLANTIIAATTLTLNTYTESDKFSVGLGYGEGSISFATQSKLREGIHGAQRTLVEAAALWALRGVYQHLDPKNPVDFSQCFAVNGPSPNATVTAYQQWLKLNERQRIKYLKLMLKELKYYTGSIDSTYDADMQKAVSLYEIDHSMLIPHTESNLGDIFISLCLQVDLPKIEKMLKQNDGIL